MADQSRTIRIPVHMVETMSRVRNVSRQLLQDLGREPTIEETANASETCLDETRRVMAMSRYPISLDRPVGNSEDSHFGDLLPDSAAESPAIGAAQEMLRKRINKVLKTLSYREREIIKLRYGLGDGYSYTLEEVGRHFKVTRERIPPDRGQGGSQAPATQPQPRTCGVPRLRADKHPPWFPAVWSQEILTTHGTWVAAGGAGSHSTDAKPGGSFSPPGFSRFGLVDPSYSERDLLFVPG